MECGIHQGGILSVLKYVAFIDSLLKNLENTGLGCQVANIWTNLVGYAADMVSACPSKANVDKTHNIIDNQAKKWRYSYYAKNSAVMVLGETKCEHDRTCQCCPKTSPNYSSSYTNPRMDESR